MPDDLVERENTIPDNLHSIARWMEAVPNHQLPGGMTLCWGDAAKHVEDAADRITTLTARLAELERATPEEVVEMAAEALRNTPLLVPGTLFDLLCTTTYANDHVIALLLRDAAANVISAIAAPLRAQGAVWQPIETAPKDGSLLLLWAPSMVEPHLGRWERQWRNNHYGDREVYWHFANVTHWMPLLEPPARIRAGGSGG